METKFNPTQIKQLEKAFELIKEAGVLFELSTNEIEDEKVIIDISNALYLSERKLRDVLKTQKTTE